MKTLLQLSQENDADLDTKLEVKMIQDEVIELAKEHHATVSSDKKWIYFEIENFEKLINSQVNQDSVNIELFKPHVECDNSCMYQCTEGFTIRAKCIDTVENYEPPTTSQEMLDAELIKAMQDGYEIHYYPPEEYLTDEANTDKSWGVRRIQAPFCGDDGIRYWSASSPIEAVNKARKAIKDKQ